MILLLFAIFLPLQAFAGVKDFGKKISIALVSQTDTFALRLSPTDASSQNTVDYRPNTTSINGFEATAYGLTLAYKTAAVMKPKDQTERGATSYEDIRGALSLGKQKQWTLVGYYNRYGGLYINNTSDFDSSFDTTHIYLQRSDFSIFNSGLAIVYVFSPEKFSLAAAVFQSAQQTESAGSFLAMTSWDGTLFSATDPIIPSSVRPQFGVDALLTSGKFTTATAAVGYGYTFTWRSFFLTGVLLMGPGYQWREYTVASETKSSTINASKTVMGGTVGYNGESFFTGLSLINNSTNYHTDSVDFAVNLTSTRFFLGMRF